MCGDLKRDQMGCVAVFSRCGGLGLSVWVFAFDVAGAFRLSGI